MLADVHKNLYLQVECWYSACLHADVQHFWRPRQSLSDRQCRLKGTCKLKFFGHKPGFESVRKRLTIKLATFTDLFYSNDSNKRPGESNFNAFTIKAKNIPPFSTFTLLKKY